MHIRGKPELAGEIAEAAKEVPQPKVKVIAEIADKLIEPIQKSVQSFSETGGRANFPAVVKHNMFRIDECVKP
jgi:S-adenosylmethionine synthetase